jgi:hypothetical protein
METEVPWFYSKLSREHYFAMTGAGKVRVA